MGRDTWGQRCQARSTRTGRHCRRYATKGATTCHVHGSATTAARARASERWQQHRALTLAGRLTPASADQLDPVACLADALTRANLVVQVLGSLVDQLDAAEQHLDRSQHSGRSDGWLASRPGAGGVSFSVVHPLLELYRQERREYARTAELAIQAGLAERQARLNEEQGALLADTIRAFLDHPAMGLTFDQKCLGQKIIAGIWRAHDDAGRAPSPPEITA